MQIFNVITVFILLVGLPALLVLLDSSVISQRIKTVILIMLPLTFGFPERLSLINIFLYALGVGLLGGLVYVAKKSSNSIFKGLIATLMIYIIFFGLDYIFFTSSVSIFKKLEFAVLIPIILWAVYIFKDNQVLISLGGAVQRRQKSRAWIALLMGIAVFIGILIDWFL
jgi:hypothetical protein